MVIIKLTVMSVPVKSVLKNDNWGPFWFQYNKGLFFFYGGVLFNTRNPTLRVLALAARILLYHVVTYNADHPCNLFNTNSFNNSYRPSNPNSNPNPNKPKANIPARHGSSPYEQQP